MFLHIRRNLLLSDHVSFRFLSTSSAQMLLESPSENQVLDFTLSNQSIHITQTKKSQFSPVLEPKFYLSRLVNCKTLAQVYQIQAQLTVNGLLRNPIIANKILYRYTLHNALENASALFSGLSKPDPFSWSVMVGGYAKSGDFLNCFRTFREYIRSGDVPDSYTLPIVIRVCRDTKNLQIGRSIHNIVYKFGLISDIFSTAALVDMYAKCKVLEDATQLFDEMPKRDLVTWTVMIGACTECGNADEALYLFDRMRDEEAVADKITMVNVVNACAKLGVMHKAKLVHDYIHKANLSLDLILGTAMIDMYAKCGSVDSAREIFDQMKDKNVISWSSMIAAYGYQGDGYKALDLFNTMLRNGIHPNNITFVSLLYACSHSGLVEEGLRLFLLMQDEYRVRPDAKHFTCMVDLFGRAGMLDHAVKLIEDMNFEKDEGLWGALLGACRMHGHIELAEKAVENLIELQPQNAGHYVLLSNIYAKAGRWEDVGKIRTLMTHQQLKKIPGWTWIEVDNKIHKFSVGDHTHPQSKEIYAELKSLELQKIFGFVETVMHSVNLCL